MSLFNLRDVTLHSGAKSSWIIDCDSLTDDDLAALAHMASKILPPFGMVHGVPKGGLRFAEALKKYVTDNEDRILIADDVCTTGGSLLEVRTPFGTNPVVAIVIFNRGKMPAWCHAVFDASEHLRHR